MLLDARSSLTYLSPDEIQRRVDWFGEICRPALAPRDCLRSVALARPRATLLGTRRR
jgi:hypothetical protein